LKVLTRIEHQTYKLTLQLLYQFCMMSVMMMMMMMMMMMTAALLQASGSLQHLHAMCVGRGMHTSALGHWAKPFVIVCIAVCNEH
jgi:hypothetical protein